MAGGGDAGDLLDIRVPFRVGGKIHQHAPRLARRTGNLDRCFYLTHTVYPLNAALADFNTSPVVVKSHLRLSRTGDHSPMRLNQASSSRMVTSSASAFFALEPASAPITT